MSAELSEQALADSKNMIADYEDYRQKRMAEYAQAKSAAVTVIEGKAEAVPQS